QKNAVLAVLNFAQSAAPLPGHAARFGSFLREAAAIDDADAVRIADLLANMLPQFRRDGLVIPLTAADKMLNRLAFTIGGIGDGFGGLALQVAQLALDDDFRQLPLFL